MSLSSLVSKEGIKKENIKDSCCQDADIRESTSPHRFTCHVEFYNIFYEKSRSCAVCCIFYHKNPSLTYLIKQTAKKLLPSPFFPHFGQKTFSQEKAKRKIILKNILPEQKKTRPFALNLLSKRKTLFFSRLFRSAAERARRPFRNPEKDFGKEIPFFLSLSALFLRPIKKRPEKN